MNVEIVTETLIFLFWEYLFRNFGVLSLQCTFFLEKSLVTRELGLIASSLAYLRLNETHMVESENEL
jgi:hypothetical protein